MTIIAEIGLDVTRVPLEGRHLSVRTIPPGEPIPGLPETVSPLLCCAGYLRLTVDISELSDNYDVTPTALPDFVRNFVEASRQPVARAGTPGRNGASTSYSGGQ